MRRIISCVLTLGVMLAASSGMSYSQEMDTVITAKSGSVLRIDAKTTKYTMENFSQENATFVLIPKEGQAAAIASISKGTDVTKVTAKKITYFPNTEDFLLEGDARIDQGNDWMTGPTRIKFESKQDRMTAVGTRAKPAAFSYRFPDGRKMESKSETFVFTFKVVDGARLLDRVETGL